MKDQRLSREEDRLRVMEVSKAQSGAERAACSSGFSDESSVSFLKSFLDKNVYSQEC